MTPLLHRLNPEAHRLLLPEEYARQLPSPADLRPHVEALGNDRQVSLEPLRAVLEEARRRGADASSTDAWLAPWLHYALRLTRREAASPAVWAYLAATEPDVQDYILRRWRPLDSSRISGPTNRQALARLWWIAELARNGNDYTPVTRAFAPQDTALWINDTDAYHNRAATIGLLQFLNSLRGRGIDVTSPRVQQIARTFRHGLTTNALDALAPDAGPLAAAIDTWVDGTPDTTLMMQQELPDGPEETGPEEQHVAAVQALFEHLCAPLLKDWQAKSARQTTAPAPATTDESVTAPTPA